MTVIHQDRAPVLFKSNGAQALDILSLLTLTTTAALTGGAILMTLAGENGEESATGTAFVLGLTAQLLIESRTVKRQLGRFSERQLKAVTTVASIFSRFAYQHIGVAAGGGLAGLATGGFIVFLNRKF